MLEFAACQSEFCSKTLLYNVQSILLKFTTKLSTVKEIILKNKYFSFNKINAIFIIRL